MISQIELQAKFRVVRQGQINAVGIWAPYLRGSIDDNHADKHVTKVTKAQRINGDAGVDPLYDGISVNTKAHDFYTNFAKNFHDSQPEDE